ncbi:MAG: hypothetical protein LBG96_06175 [Tannerella sp.]|jgi:hypothetical protein|nr:hypothetical protein [Tannerella sp.]
MKLLLSPTRFSISYEAEMNAEPTPSLVYSQGFGVSEMDLFTCLRFHYWRYCILKKTVMILFL